VRRACDGFAAFLDECESFPCDREHVVSVVFAVDPIATNPGKTEPARTLYSATDGAAADGALDATPSTDEAAGDDKSRVDVSTDGAVKTPAAEAVPDAWFATMKVRVGELANRGVYVQVHTVDMTGAGGEFLCKLSDVSVSSAFSIHSSPAHMQHTHMRA
jgi:hypothetical protein